MKTMPPAGLKEEHWRGNDADDGDQGTDGHIHIGYRRHAGHGRGKDDEGGNDVGAQLRRDGLGKDQMQHVSAAAKLVAGDGDIGNQYGDGAKHPRCLVVTGLEQIRQGELGESARPGGNKVDEQ